MVMAAHTINKNVVGSPSSCTTHDHDHDQRNKKRKRDDSVGRRRNNNWGRLTSHSVETNVVCVCLSLGGASCSTLSCSTMNNKKKKTCNYNDVDVETLRNWECSTLLMLYDDPWKIKKVLTQTDLGNNSRLLLNKEFAQDLVVPVLGAEAAENEGVHVAVWDVDTDSLHSLVFKIRPSNKSPVFKETWIKDFVVRRGLKKGDEIGMHWDPYKKRFDFKVLRAYRRQVIDQH